MSRLYGEGLPIEVEMDENGIPVCFTLNGQVYQVTHVAERWRVDEEWWSDRAWREYYKVVVGSAVLLLYREYGERVWYVQRMYD